MTPEDIPDLRDVIPYHTISTRDKLLVENEKLQLENRLLRQLVTDQAHELLHYRMQQSINTFPIHSDFQINDHQKLDQFIDAQLYNLQSRKATRACDQCRVRKRKCDMSLPKCSTCTKGKRGSSCTYNQSLPKRPVKRKLEMNDLKDRLDDGDEKEVDIVQKTTRIQSEEPNTSPITKPTMEMSNSDSLSPSQIFDSNTIDLHHNQLVELHSELEPDFIQPCFDMGDLLGSTRLCNPFFDSSCS
ncbi:hypothetical protein BC833DRAFT_626261 [Globomyces pollinis-pini]|nr:hypothetical protein BC833DRAFT_626261 [Globomyces pollinis-pini]